MADHKYELLYTDNLQCRGMLKGNDVAKLIAKATQRNAAHYAVYRTYVNGENFHNATDEKFLVCHSNDPYWIAQEKKSL